MKYTLMHKNIKIIDIELDDITGSIYALSNTYNISHLPVGTLDNDGSCDRTLVNKWWLERSIPASRIGIQDVLDDLNISSPTTMLSKCLGLSLFDQYWIKPIDSDLKWENVNFFDNAFSEDMGNILLGEITYSDDLNLNSPDNTTEGCLTKRWKIIDGKRFLIKAGSPPYEQQSFNEVVASLIMDKLKIEHTTYTLTKFNDKPYCLCEDFINKDTELVSASKILKAHSKPNHLSLYQHYINVCKELGILDIEEKLDQMIVLDFIVANEDRHLNNFGLIRDANTLRYLSVAPIYDSGSSLGYNKVTENIGKQTQTTCKPFKKTHFDQLKLVKSFDWIDFGALNNIEEDVLKVFESADINIINDERKNKIISSIKERINYIHELVQRESQVRIDDINQDVIEDVSEDYTNDFDLTL